MSCPTCTDPARCVVDRRCTQMMELDKCDWPKSTGESPYYTWDATGKLVHPYITNFVSGVHDKNVEGFGLDGMSQTNSILVLVLLVLIAYCIFSERK